MPAKTKKIEVLTFPLDTKPGSLSNVYKAFLEVGLNVHASWAYEMGENQAQAHIWASDTKKAADVLKKMGKQVKTEHACWAEGDDKVGEYGELLQKIANAGVNLHATDALSVGGKFATVFFCEERDISQLCKALSC